MPTFIKTGFWDKLINNNPQQAKAPKGWLNLDRFVKEKARPYKVYTALLAQDGSSTPPTAIVFQDDFNGDFTYTRDSSGVYKIISALQLFDPSKTFILIGNTAGLSIRDMITYNITNPTSEINLFTTDENDILKDGILVNTPIEIRIYP